MHPHATPRHAMHVTLCMVFSGWLQVLPEGVLEERKRRNPRERVRPDDPEHGAFD